MEDIAGADDAEREEDLCCLHDNNAEENKDMDEMEKEVRRRIKQAVKNTSGDGNSERRRRGRQDTEL